MGTSYTHAQGEAVRKLSEDGWMVDRGGYFLEDAPSGVDYGQPPHISMPFKAFRLIPCVWPDTCGAVDREHRHAAPRGVVHIQPDGSIIWPRILKGLQ